MIHSNRNTAKVAMPATIWFFVRLEMNSPSEMKQPPKQEQAQVGRRDRLPLRVCRRRTAAPMWSSVTASIDRVERHRAEELAEDDLEVGERRGQQQLDRARPLLLGDRSAS